MPSVLSRVTATVSDCFFFLFPPLFCGNLPNQIKCFWRLLHAGSSTVKVHDHKYDAAQDLQLYMNSQGALVQVGVHCTINGNYCAMIVVVVAGGAAS